jgi:hypothetical protein
MGVAQAHRLGSLGAVSLFHTPRVDSIIDTVPYEAEAPQCLKCYLCRDDSSAGVVGQLLPARLVGERCEVLEVRSGPVS